MTTGSSGLSRALERALRELPAGTAQARLTHYCGRLWDLLRSADFLASCRSPVSGSDAVADEVGAPLVSCLAAVAALVSEGVDRGEFTAVSSRGVARLLVSSLFARARWCGQRVDPRLRGSCSRAVAETLELILPALGVWTTAARRPEAGPP